MLTRVTSGRTATAVTAFCAEAGAAKSSALAASTVRSRPMRYSSGTSCSRSPASVRADMRSGPGAPAGAAQCHSRLCPGST
jgi:hypothetical protein